MGGIGLAGPSRLLRFSYLVGCWVNEVTEWGSLRGINFHKGEFLGTERCVRARHGNDTGKRVHGFRILAK